IKHYQIPGTADVTNEIIATGDGFIVMCRNRGPSDIHLFKINHNGDVLWARKYDFAENDNTYFYGGSGNELVMMEDALYFTAYAEEDGRRDMILVKTDLEGQIAEDCDIITSIDIAVTTVNNAEYYPISADIFTFVPDLIALEVSPSTTSLQTENTCAFYAPETEIEESICMGDVYEGYDQAGTYVDTFSLANGCDSIRILHLRLLNCDPLVVYDLNACAANMVTGTNMVYTEFVPQYPEVSTCAAVSAGYLFRSPPQENKHSCTPGLNSTTAMCVSALSGCTYQPGNSASVVIEVNLTPELASLFQFTALQFYEKAPTTYTWIDGDSGPNNYPTLFGIRILKNGTEIYNNPAVPTATTWNLKEFDFTDDTLFEIEVPTLFRIELLPYCPVGNGAAVSAWDLEDIVILGGCLRLPGADPFISGNVFTSKGTPVPNVELHISRDHAFSVYEAEDVNAFGAYQFANLHPGGSHYLKAHHNHDFLQGVSTMDILAIQKHLLGIKPFTLLDQYVAADINHDGRVNISDLITLRKSLLGHTPNFPLNTSWRFGVWPQSLESTDPASLQEVAFIESLQSGPTTIDFLGIKIGDLNGNVFMRATNDPIVGNSPSFELAIEDVEIKRGKPFTIEL
ncbi:MAG TPA: dockerin type I domain-containing protein, partial [Saprospiraceae bacterium]